MRLLKIPHDLEDLTLVPQLEDFTGKVPPYAILSHTWGSQGSEVTYSDIVNGTHRSKPGWQKTVKAVKIAQKHRLHYLWCDTYCIDKSSSAELSEAINSMYEWYGKAICCYAYLDDVNCVEGSADWDGIIKRSRWFTRGWTLQELLAPGRVEFFNAKWVSLGYKTSEHLGPIISEVTRIPLDVLSRLQDIETCSIACRMSWAARRETTRPEDVAYCLLGIFGVNMPLLYGEGAARAFKRLQEEIIRISADQSIFAWDPDPAAKALSETVNLSRLHRSHTDQVRPSLANRLDSLRSQQGRGVLAPRPSFFAGAADVVPCDQRISYTMTNVGLKTKAPIISPPFPSADDRHYWILSCNLKNDHSKFVAIQVFREEQETFHKLDTNFYTRSAQPNTLFAISAEAVAQAQPQSVYISNDNSVAHGKAKQAKSSPSTPTRQRFSSIQRAETANGVY